MKNIGRYIYLLPLALFLLPIVAQAQFGIDGPPHSSAVLDLKGTNKAFYPPRQTTAQRNAILDPQAGAIVFDTEKASLFIYDGANWQMMAFTTAENQLSSTGVVNDASPSDKLGTCVCISGDYAIIGAPNDDVGANADQGSAYVFFRTGGIWTQQAKLTASDGAVSDNFGMSVSIYGDYAIVGTPNDNISSITNQGSAYIFVRSGTTWAQQAKLIASDGAESDRFGNEVAIFGDYAIAGSPSADIGSNNGQGAAYIFIRSGNSWSQQIKLVAGDGESGNQFGLSVALNGDYALVGAPKDNIGSNSDEGSVYVFLRSGTNWPQQAKLTPSFPVGEVRSKSFFGNSVALSGIYALIGSPGDHVGTNADQGSAYVFVRSGTSWTQQAKLTASDGAISDNFGSSVSVTSDYALIGSPEDDITSSDRKGSAYLFRRTDTAWTQVRKIAPTSPNSTQNGTSVSITTNGFIIGGPGFNSSQGKVTFGTTN